MNKNLKSGFLSFRHIFILAILLITVFILIYYSRNFLNNMLSTNKLKSFPFVENFISKPKKEVYYSTPLRSNKNATNSYLTKNGVISWTNRMREQEGLPVLLENELLNKSAKKKLDDMFQRQYFEHETPTGEGPADFVEAANYEYITIGENLALGNFLNDKELVDGWMNSPGHRANILNSKYKEIGVAVGQGVYEGKKTWLAVQHFGKPISACPTVDESLLAVSKEKRAQADALSQDLESRKKELETTQPKTSEEAEQYNTKVNEYNEKVKQYNALIEEIKNLTNEYNTQVKTFNSCADS